MAGVHGVPAPVPASDVEPDAPWLPGTGHTDLVAAMAFLQVDAAADPGYQVPGQALLVGGHGLLVSCPLGERPSYRSPSSTKPRPAAASRAPDPQEAFRPCAAFGPAHEDAFQGAVVDVRQLFRYLWTV